MELALKQSSRPRVQSMHIIYDADGTFAGEFVYIVKKILGLAHCAACDITHGPKQEKPEFTKIKSSWKVPLYNIHRDEMDARMKSVTYGRLPCVVARTEKYDLVLVDSDALEACHGDVFLFQSVLDEALRHADLEVEPASPQFCSLETSRVPEIVDGMDVNVFGRNPRRYSDDEQLEGVEAEAVVPSM